MRYRVEIDATRCAGTSNCVEVAPDAYDIGDAGLAILRVGCQDEAQVLEGARSCPMDAILVYDNQTGARIYP